MPSDNKEKQLTLIEELHKTNVELIRSFEETTRSALEAMMTQQKSFQEMSMIIYKLIVNHDHTLADMRSTSVHSEDTFEDQRNTSADHKHTPADPENISADAEHTSATLEYFCRS